MEEYYLNQSVSQECVLLPNNFNSMNCLLKENYLSELSTHPEKALENLGINNKFEELDTSINTINNIIGEPNTSNENSIFYKLEHLDLTVNLSDITVIDDPSKRNMNELLRKGIYRNCNLGRPYNSVNGELYTLVTIPFVKLFTGVTNPTIVGGTGNYTKITGYNFQEYYNDVLPSKNTLLGRIYSPNSSGTVLLSLIASRARIDGNASLSPKVIINDEIYSLVYEDAANGRTDNISIEDFKTFEVSINSNYTDIRLESTDHNWWVMDVTSAQGYSPILQVCFSQLTGKYYYRMLYSRNTEVKHFPETMYNDWMTASDFNELNSKISDLQNLLNNVNTTLSNNKADKTDVNNLTTTVSNKADKTIVNELTETVNGLDGRLDTVETILGNLPKQVDLGPYLKKETTNTDNIPKVTVTANSITLNSADIDLQSDSIKLRDVSFVDNTEISGQPSINLGNNDKRLHLRGNEIYTYRKENTDPDNILKEYEVWDKGNLKDPLYNVRINGQKLQSNGSFNIITGETPSLVLTNYNKANTTATSLETGDTYQTAFGKLENLIDNKLDKIADIAGITDGASKGKTALQPSSVENWAKTNNESLIPTSKIDGIDDYANKIESIKINGINQVPDNKSINLSIPNYSADNGIKIDGNVIKHLNNKITPASNKSLYKLKFDNFGHITEYEEITIDSLVNILSSYFAQRTDYVNTTSITITPSPILLTDSNLTQQLTATILPENATNKNVVWTSSNPDVATVNNEGLVTAVSNSEFTITATITDPGQPPVSATVNGTVSLENIQTHKYFVGYGDASDFNSLDTLVSNSNLSTQSRPDIITIPSNDSSKNYALFVYPKQWGEIGGIIDNSNNGTGGHQYTEDNSYYAWYWDLTETDLANKVVNINWKN